jgi:hypothetical protein
MGNVLLDLDARFGKVQFNYYTARSRLDFVEACQMLYEANANLPLEASIEDLPLFEPTSNTYRNEHSTDEQALNYCNKYAPIIWRAIAIYTETMLERLRDD